MDAGGLDRVDGSDGACELAFQGAHQVDVLHEIGGAEAIGIVEDLVADRAARRQALLRQGDPGSRHQVGGNVDGAAAVAQLIGDLVALELRHDPRRVVHIEVGVEQLELGGGQTRDDPEEEAGKSKHHPADDRNSHRTEITHDLEDCLHDLSLAPGLED